MVPMLLLALLAGSAVPAFADDDVNARLDQLAHQTHTGVQVQSGTAEMVEVVVPDQTEVQMEIDEQTGETESERLASYVVQLEGQISAKADAEALTKLAIAYQMQGSHDKAQATAEQALGMEPAAEALYDLLAQELSVNSSGLKVYVNGHPISFDVDPVIVNGRTLVPIRAIAERLGAKVSWNPDTATATVELGQYQVAVTRDSTTAVVNGQTVTLDVAATIVGGRTMLPLRFVSESLKEHVGYHPGVSGTAVISITDTQ